MMSVSHIIVVCIIITPTISIYVQNESRNITKRQNPSSLASDWTELADDGIFSSLLEEWTLNNK